MLILYYIVIDRLMCFSLSQVELSDCCDTFLRRGIDGHGFLVCNIVTPLLHLCRVQNVRNIWLPFHYLQLYITKY